MALSPVLLLETLWCILVVLLGLLAFGLPVQWLLAGRRPLEEADWARAPLMGLATIVLCAQALVYGEVPVGRSAPWLWAAVLPLWVWMFRRGGIRRHSIPLALLGAALAVYLLHGCGLLVGGARYYVGRAWGDQFNYTVLADFLQHQPFSLNFDEIGLRPHVFMAIVHKEHRIGQSVAHAFFAASVFRDAKTTFEPVILLCPALAFLSLHEVRRGLVGSAARGWALLGCAAAALIPGLALVHLEGFLSQCLGIPALLLWPVVLRDLAEAPRARTMAAAWLVVAALTAIYMEFLPIAFGVAGAALLAAALRQPAPRRLLAALMLIPLPILLFVMTPAWIGIVQTAHYVGMAMLGFLYPWAYTLEGLTRIWCGDLVVLANGPVRTLLHGASAALTAGGCLGLVQGLRDMWRRAGPAGAVAASGALALGVAVCLLVLLPLLVLIPRGDHTYQFYKLVLTVSPVVALGMTLLRVPRIRTLLVALMLVLALAGTALMTARAGLGVPEGRSHAASLAGREARGLADALTSLRDKDLVLLEHDADSTFNAWLTYLGRHNRIWLGSSVLNLATNLAEHPVLQQAADLVRVPRDAVFLSSVRDPWTAQPPGARRLWSNQDHALWQWEPGPWATIVYVRNPNGLEELRGKPFLWLGAGDTRFFVLAGQPGTVRLSAKFLVWGGARKEIRRVRVRTTGGHDQTFALGHGPGTLKLPVVQGMQEFRLTPEEPGRPVPPDTRPIYLGVLAPELSFKPDAANP